ncbi:codanin-1 isoform X2 [Periplaneta americana]|uniref:codanin-1 isoform X2 n=1 Tax=Periplaneta americana TaxID=6978 RepID=UPI0037E7EDDE
MAADVLNELICHKIPVDDFISWLKAENLESCSTTWKCGRKDFVPYFLNFLRTQTSRLLKLGSRSTPSKVQRTLQERKNSRRSRLELFPLNQHSDGDISGGIRSLDVSSVDLQDVKEQGSPSDDVCGKKRSDTMKKRIMMSPGGDCGSPLAQSSPLQTSESSHRRSSRDPDSLQRSFNLEEFIVKSNRSSRKKSESQSSSKSRKRINPTRLGSGKSKESGTCFGLASQSCEPSATFCEQPLEMSRSHNFEEERTLLRKVRQRCDGLVAVSPAKMVATSCVEFLEADPALEFTLGNDSGGNSLDILKEVNPDKLSRLRERLVTPIPSGGPCPLPTFPGQQEFYRNFILHSSHPMFLQHLTDSLISEILDLNDTDFTASDLEDTDTSVDDATRSSYLACVSALRLLAKFLGFIVFLPYQSKINPLPESMVTAHSTVRAKLCPQFDVLACVNEAVRMHKLVLTLPWIVKYLSMMDSVSVHLPYYWAVFEQLFCIYQSAKGPGRSSLLVRLLLGWLFESPNFPESLFYAWKQTNNLVETGGELGRVVPLDSLDVVDEHCLYLCCPFLGELKLCLSVGIGSSSRSVKHITPVSASLNQPSAARQIELLLEESFFHGQPASTRKTVEYIAERVASCCVKHICNTLLPRVKQQGSANVEKLLSARINTDTPFSETAVKQLKESLLKEVTVIADKCSDDFRQCFYNDVTEYCQQRCKRAMPPLLADDVLETVCHTCAQIAARLSQERVNMWIQSHITAGLFLKEFQLDIEKAFRNASKGDNKNDSICKASHVVPPGGRNVKHIDAVVTPAQAIMQVRELIWQLLDGHKNNVSEQQVLALLKMVHSTLSNRADLIPSAEKMLPTLLVDLALSLVVHQPAMMTSTLMDGFMHVLRLSEECESVMRLLCPRNLLLMSQSAHTADVVWSCFAKLLAHLLKSNMLTPDGLEQQCVALLQVTWPQGILNRISSCIREVIQLSGSVGDEKFMFLMQWLMETCDEMTLFNDI